MCTSATVRSHRLPPGHQTQLDVTFYTGVDRPGRHGEVVALTTNDARTTRRAQRFPLKSEIAFFITTNPRR